MTVVILLEEDAFHATPEQIVSATTDLTSRSNGLWIRRPTRGIQASPNTFSTIQVRSAGKKPVPLINSSAPADQTKSAPMTANYILQSVSESRDEKLQLLETFGQAYGFFFGERPRVVQFSGTLVNTADFNWRSEWWANYENVFRGTKLVERNARLYITYDDIVLEGYMLNAAIGQQAESSPNLVSLNFSMWVTGHTDSSGIGDATFPGHSTLRGLEDARVAGVNAVLESEADAADAAARQAVAEHNAELHWLVEDINAGEDGDSPYRVLIDQNALQTSVAPEGFVPVEGVDRDTIRSNIFDNADEYVYRSNDHSLRVSGVEGLQQWITNGWEDPNAAPENPTEVNDKSFGVLKKNLSGNLQGAMTQSGGQMLAANGEVSAGSVDSPPTHGGMVLRDQMLPTGVDASRFGNMVVIVPVQGP